MAHQCLSCGHLFPEGSSAILQGCPQCKGTRFFYTKQALPDADRKAMAEKAQRDLREVVADILKSTPASADMQARVAGGLAGMRPSELRELVKAAAAQAPAKAPAPWPQAPEATPKPQPYVLHAQVEDRRTRLEAHMAQASLAPDHPDTVNIRKPGQYDIDVAALLDHNPIVVHKDGAYHIHLASLFDSATRDQ